MERRTFLAMAGAAGAAALSGASFVRWQEITPTVHYPGRDEGHFLRDRRRLPPPSRVIDTDIWPSASCMTKDRSILMRSTG